jgi:tripartite ATP-independent transporter DctM subunit
MLIVGFVGILYVASFDSAVNMLTADLWNQLASYSFSVIPLFILMGELIFRSGVTQGLFNTAHNWMGHYKGGMASTTILASAGFATISGSNSATAATMGTIALPELKRYNYDDRLSAGSVASGGTLGIIIPPSTVLIVLAIQTQQSIKQIFMASIVPSIILVALFLLLIAVMAKMNPALGPAGDKKPLRVRVSSLKEVLPIIVLFLFVIGGLFAGWFTPTESAAFGALGAFVLIK